MTETNVPVHAVGDADPASVAAVDRAVNNAIEREIDPVSTLRYPIYVASKIEHFGMWKELRRKWKPHNIDIVSTWIDKIDPATGDKHKHPLHLAADWIENIRDLTACKTVVCYAEETTQMLRGALVEVGVAIGQHKPVIIVGDPDLACWGSWQYHPLVTYARTLDGARNVIDVMRGRARPETR